MEQKIVVCKTCGEFVGVETSRGMMIENIILKSFDGICANCEEELSYQLEFLTESYMMGMCYGS